MKETWRAINGKVQFSEYSLTLEKEYPIPKPKKHDKRLKFLKYANSWKYDEWILIIANSRNNPSPAANAIRT